MVITLFLGLTPALANAVSGGQLQQQAQVLTWTAGDDFRAYMSVPTSAVAGPATLVFENSAATGNTSGMQHTLTFDTGNPAYNRDVDVNILADPYDSKGGRWTVDVVLTPGVYHYFCAIPGHGAMSGLLVVSGGNQDTTPPTVTAALSGDQDRNGAYVGAATVTLTATDTESGVEKVEYSLDGSAYTTYTTPVTVTQPGQHTVTYRATDRAGNTSEPATITFTVVTPPDPDTTPPTVTAVLSGQQDGEGSYVGAATVTLTATDTESGVDKIEYSLDGQAYATYSSPVTVNHPGQHTVTYRATDRVGNTSEPATVTFTVVAVSHNPECPVLDTRPVVWLGTVNTGLPNRLVGDGCTINNLIASERNWLNHAEFVTHVKAIAEHLLHLGVVSKAERKSLIDQASASAVGKADNQNGYETILDRSGASFKQWEQVGAGGFTRNADGSITSLPVNGLGMLWFPIRQYGDFSMKLQWRDDAPGDKRANSGVFVRFPGVHKHPQEPRPEWVAIKYGHEIQILDAADGDRYKTGSVYGFRGVDLDGAQVTTKGTWNDLEIRVVGQHYSIYRNGELVNEFINTPGAVFDPPRSDDPGSAGRQNASGYVGLQVHGAADVVSFRNVRVAPLNP
ncbi:family 16 glycoside hydrolase [Micromonospora sp. NPDC048999]|uniref:OmpL47-type beta-barrel domain-containing protein n=1 Tax=Micromonospora sp. NPDC048999 TaxID=3155391 RepID=UPI0033E550F3